MSWLKGDDMYLEYDPSGSYCVKTALILCEQLPNQIDQDIDHIVDTVINPICVGLNTVKTIIEAAIK